jgi:hypothetical protein
MMTECCTGEICTGNGALTDNIHVLLLQERILMKDKSHMTEVVQQARMELENGQVDEQELESSISVRMRACVTTVLNSLNKI